MLCLPHSGRKYTGTELYQEYKRILPEAPLSQAQEVRLPYSNLDSNHPPFHHCTIAAESSGARRIFTATYVFSQESMFIFLAELAAGFLPVLAFDIRIPAAVQEHNTKIITGGSTITIFRGALHGTRARKPIARKREYCSSARQTKWSRDERLAHGTGAYRRGSQQLLDLVKKTLIEQHVMILARSIT